MKHNRNVVLFIASSLDGYIATKDDSLDWLFKVEGKGDNGYSEFYETVDTVVMGKKTYDWLLKHDLEEFPYKNKACYVFTQSATEDTEDVRFVNEDVVQFTNTLRAQEGKNIWIVGGGELLHSFIKKKLVDEMIITVAPQIIGEGIPLFKAGDYQIDLTLKGTRTFNQFVELHYIVN
ncbi:dihydrofolate reductase family protein [Robertmurraya kyonggiensis]|uniref:Dihydrofolate reductase n=1 Tax=Robertmurraya kyonggiensis TaxID=1037680 RepID=A0A4U1DEA3_9BACI|nr:dihydrofolate reductase family protein [Robertmurraya kyonggiensis]TKC19847.1 dihydrofolate reductase [Robertmurraya kyonggiensis]